MKQYLRLAACAFALSSLLGSTSVLADTAVSDLASRWADITYARPESEQKALLEALYDDAKQEAAADPDNADLLTWAGIIGSSYAGARGGFGALGIVKRARTYYQDAMAIDPEALDGGARTSLGVLYYQVPPWPIGFGKSERAEELLQESYDKHPDNIDALYFYGDFLDSQNRTQEARRVFRQAMALPVETASEIGRQKQIQERMGDTGN